MRRYTPAFVAFAGCSLIASAALAQSNPAKDSHLDATTASPADKPITVADAPASPAADADIARLVTLFTGSFAAPAGDNDRPALVAHSAPVRIDGLNNAVLMEIGRADAPASPFRLAVLHPYRRQGALRLRVFDLTGNPGLKDALVGHWAAPEAFPKLSASHLTPNVDMPLSADDAGFKGATTQPFPTMRDGAIEMTSSITIDDKSLTIADAGFDADGKRVWGNDAAQPVAFHRVQSSAPSARTLDGGLTIITLVPPAPGAPVLADNGDLTAHYTGWLTDGTRFDTSRQQGREPFKIRIPGPVIKGWNEGLKGIAKGERRRLIIPPELGYGDRGAGRGLIPANSTLIFDVEALYIDNTQPTPPPSAAPAPAPSQGHPGGAPKPADAPFGKPPTNSAPEKPR